MSCYLQCLVLVGIPISYHTHINKFGYVSARNALFANVINYAGQLFQNDSNQ